MGNEAPPFNDDHRAQTLGRVEDSEIKRIFHPHSKGDPKFESLKNYVTTEERLRPMDKAPWTPFRSEFDFEFAEYCTQHMLNKDAIVALISLIRRSNTNPKDFTIANHQDLEDLWVLAAHKCTEVPFHADNSFHPPHISPSLRRV